MDFPILKETQMPKNAPIPEKINEENDRMSPPQSTGTYEPIMDPINIKNHINHFGTIVLYYFL
ncbi:MAG: hypothetical protein ACD_56C00141G0013 [uncultured bacterium]|nr:MAG: hypothetical protein ACD_56C00141G0013 [uncultured bacterium]